MEASNLYDGDRNRPTPDRLNLGFINLNSFIGYNITKKDNLGSE